MATKHISISGTVEWCKPWPGQLDVAFVDDKDGKPDPRGGNWNTNLILDDEGVRLFKALGVKSKLKEGSDGKLRIATFRRYERHPVLGELGPVKVTGVEEGTSIGNGSKVTIHAEVYDFTYNGRPGRGLRWEGVTVDELIEYVRDETKEAVGVPVF